MQLPRGRFDRFVQDGTILGIIKELGKSGYSGRCSGTFNESAIELVFQDGVIVLAESSANSGADTLSELLSNPGGKVAAELSVYNTSELKLAGEFNPKCTVTKEVFDSLFSDAKEETVSLFEEITEETGKKSLSEVKEAEEEENPCGLFIDESEIESIAINFRSGARDLLKRINLEHLITDDKSGEDNDD